MAKPKVAFYWCASCGGCEEAVVDLHEDILPVVNAVDIVFWPVALDFKYKDVEAMADGEIAVSFINGSIRLEEQERIVRLLRRKSGLVVAFGSCAHLGGIPSLANFYTKDSIFELSYTAVPSVVNLERVFPEEKVTVDGKELTLPKVYNTVYALDQVIDVDYYLPGCAPPKDLIVNAVNAILTGNLPPKGAVLASNKVLCDTCPRNEKKPEKLKIKEVKRVHEVIPDPTKCFLEEGLICLGPVTRGGCGERCISANMPCRGCFGPMEEIIDQGSKFLSTFASLLDNNDEEEIKKIVATIADPAGTFYRFSMATSALRRKRMEA